MTNAMKHQNPESILNITDEGLMIKGHYPKLQEFRCSGCLCCESITSLPTWPGRQLPQHSVRLEVSEHSSNSHMS